MDCCEYVNENSTSSDEKNELRIMLVLGAKFQTWEELEVTSRRRGRPPNRYLSEGETVSKNKKQKMTIDLELQHIPENNNNGNNKKQKKCKRCEGLGHDLRNCKSKIHSERN
ncbi:hypothetical protein RhiirA4_547939 [Rhizophagus irregularis]|uniref:CCHC-type domain-containing protein n=1 Tax=Rhizophagus irregularis TaxID=588596 RepID=A0A2I1H4Y8_9GLOM|nr:hypothetical protein RhiirA4_547939 [Rhizophagus irregularis]